ncbi:MAG: helix-turn-helix transcriptional regulator [Roseburia sp.]|nr:helix-turn-helix transcriptional regulator [Roseburia sp.]
MNQKKIGSFLKELRNEKGITQEQFAEILCVSGRTVSRWETGANMPDISLLVEIADFFDVSIPEIINGERKNEKMNEKVKEVAEALSDYATTEKETLIKNVRTYSIVGSIAVLVYCILDLTGLHSEHALFENISLYCQTLIPVIVIMIMAHTTGLLNKMQKRNKNSKIAGLPKPVQVVIAAVVAFISAAIIKLFLTNIWGL